MDPLRPWDPHVEESQKREEGGRVRRERRVFWSRVIRFCIRPSNGLACPAGHSSQDVTENACLCDERKEREERETGSGD